MDGDDEIRRLKRQILAVKERQKSYAWQAAGGFTIAFMGVVALVTSLAHWTFLWMPLLIIGMSIVVVCIVMAGYYLMRSFVVRPPTDGEADSPTSHTTQM